MQHWEYHPAPDIGETLGERLHGFPRQPRMLEYALRLLAELLLRSWMRLYHRLTIAGRQNLPTEGSYIVVCNHTSHLDTLALLCAMPLKNIHHTYPAAAADYFFTSLPRCAVSSILINALPFDRDQHGSESLARCRNLLDGGRNALILFPEGTRTTTGRLGRFRSGIGRLAAGSDIPVIPCFLEGGVTAWPKGAWFPKPRKLRLCIGEPRNFSNLGTDRASVESACATLRDDVQCLGGRAS